jgi:hypothetical protein
VKHFSLSYFDNRPRPKVREAALTDLAPSMGRAGYPLERQDERSFTFVRRYRSGWVIAVAILFFPIGLLALLAEKKTAMVLVTLEEVEGGTKVILTGEAWKRLREHLEALSAE